MQTKIPPGPPPVKKNPLSMLRYFLGFRKDPIAWISDRFSNYGDLYCTLFGSSRIYIMRHPEHIQHVLINNAANYQKTEQGNVARQLRRFLGNGLLNSNGEFWRRQRRMIQPAFLKKRIEGYAEIMVDYTQTMLEQWRDQHTLDISREMMKLTLCIVNRTLFDHHVAAETDSAAQRILQFRKLATTPQLLPKWLSPRYNRRNKKAVEEINSLVYGMIEKRRSSGQLGQDLLSTLLAAVDTEGDNETMSHQQLRDELLTLYFAGHDTTSHALTWTLYLLSQNRDVEAQLQREVDTVLADKRPTAEDIKQLPFTEMVVSEAMRLFPPAYAISRTAKEDDQIAGYDIPAGTEIVIWIYMVHHDPRWFPQPQQFRPERFAPEEKKKLPQCAYMPFGAGGRICIGKEFAMMEAKLILAMIMRQYSLALVEGHKVDKGFAVTLAPKHGMPMVLTKRNI